MHAANRSQHSTPAPVESQRNTTCVPVAELPTAGTDRASGRRPLERYPPPAAAVEPAALRTFTPSLAVIARSDGCYHWTPEGRKLADFTSGVLVANLGHNPARWWRRVLGYMGLGSPGRQTGQFVDGRAADLVQRGDRARSRMAAERLVAVVCKAAGRRPHASRCCGPPAAARPFKKRSGPRSTAARAATIILATRYGFHGKKGLAGAVTGSETDPERDPRVRFIGFPQEECISVERRRAAARSGALRRPNSNGLWSELGSADLPPW